MGKSDGVAQVGRNGVLREFGEDHALLGAALDLAEKAGYGTAKLFLLGERVAATSPVIVGLVDAQRQVGLLRGGNATGATCLDTVAGNSAI